MKIKTLFSAVVLHTACLYSQNWVQPNSGDWGVGANWSGGTVPNSVGATAIFPNTNTAAATISLMTVSPTVGTIEFENAMFTYTISPVGSNVLTFAAAGNAALNLNLTSTTGPGQSISSPVTLTSNLVVNQNASVNTNTFTFSGIVSGAGSLTIGGANVAPVILSATNNTYSGGTILNNGGILQCGVSSTLPGGSMTINAGGTLSVNGTTQTIGTLTGAATGAITLGAGTLTSNATTSSTYAGTISGNGGFTLAGSGGTLIFPGPTGQLSYAGTTTINGSTLQIGANDTLPLPPFKGAVTVNSPGVLNLANFNQTIGPLMGNGSITLGSGTLTVDSTVSTTFSGVISGSGGLTIATNLGTPLTLSGNNTYTGTTFFMGGSLTLAVSNAIYSGVTPGTVNMNVGGGATLDMSAAASTQQTIGPLIGASGAFINLGTTVLTINSPTTTTWGGVIQQTGGVGSVVLTGPGTLILANMNTYTGGTTVNNGTLQLSPAGLSNALAPTGNLAINSPGTVMLSNNTGQTIGNLTGNGSLQLGSLGMLTINPTSSSTFSGNITGLGGITVGGSAPLILTGTNSYAGGTTVNGGATLQGTTTALQGSIMNSGSLMFNQSFPGTFVGSIFGGGSITINGGPITFNTAQMAAGGTTIASGELIILSPAILTSNTTIASGAILAGNGTVAGSVNNNGTLELDLNNFSVMGNYNQNAGSFLTVDITPTSSGSLTVTTGAVTITSPATLDVDISSGAYQSTTVYTLITDTVAPVAGTYNPPVFDNPFFQGTLIYNQDPAFAGSVQLSVNIAPFNTVIKGGNAGAIANCINLEAFPAESDLLPIINTLIFLPIHEVREALDVMQPSQLKALSIAEENNLVVIRSTISQRLDDLNKSDCNQCMSELNNWGVWGNFSGDFLREEEQRGNPSFDATTAAATIGFDVEPAENRFVGVAAAYDYSWLEWSHSRGDAHISSVYGGPYFSCFNRRFFANISALGSWNNYHASRHIVFPSVDVHAESNHPGYGLMGHVDIGVMTYPAAEMTFSPFGGLDYIYLWEKGYTERGAGALNMKIHQTHASLLRSELGFKIGKCSILKHNKWSQDLKLSWIHQYLIKGKKLHAEFAEVNCVYTVVGVRPNQDYLNVAAGITGYFKNDRLSGALRYEGKFGDGIVDNTVYAQLTYRF